MEKESFENEAIAKLMNENFINIKVDREVRPDVDKVYMLFVQVRKYMYCLHLNILTSILGHFRERWMAHEYLDDTKSASSVRWYLLSSK